MKKGTLLLIFCSISITVYIILLYLSKDIPGKPKTVQTPKDPPTKPPVQKENVTRMDGTEGPKTNLSIVHNWIKMLDGNSEICKRNTFVSIWSGGRLGNKMYVYSQLLGFCLTYHCIPVMKEQMREHGYSTFPNLHMPRFNHIEHCNITWVNKDYFKDLVEEWKINGRSSGNGYNHQMFPSNSSFFAPYFDIIKSELRFPYGLQNKVDRTINSIMKHYKTDTVVGFHIRRKDMPKHLKVTRGFVMNTDYYFKAAMDFHLKKRPQSVFAVISDDVLWCKTHVTSGNKYRVVFPGADKLFDMAFLSSCNHSISTYGTFGFMGTYLANGDVVYPEKSFPHTHFQRQHGYSNWFPIPAFNI